LISILLYNKCNLFEKINGQYEYVNNKYDIWTTYEQNIPNFYLRKPSLKELNFIIGLNNLEKNNLIKIHKKDLANCNYSFVKEGFSIDVLERPRLIISLTLFFGLIGILAIFFVWKSKENMKFSILSYVASLWAIRDIINKEAPTFPNITDYITFILLLTLFLGLLVKYLFNFLVVVESKQKTT